MNIHTIGFTYFGVLLSACRPTLRAVDAAGAARGLGAIFGGGAVPPAVPVYGSCQRRN